MIRTVMLCNGTDAAFVTTTDNETIVHLFENVCLHSISADPVALRVDVFGDMRPRFVDAGVSLNIEMKGARTKQGGTELLEAFVTADSLSIEGLLHLVQKRILERE